jgi:hypothetical protein
MTVARQNAPAWFARVMTVNFVSGINESASPSIAERFIAAAKTTVRLGPGKGPFGCKRHEPDIASG